jgi:hypothetical protein
MSLVAALSVRSVRVGNFLLSFGIDFQISLMDSDDGPDLDHKALISIAF